MQLAKIKEKYDKISAALEQAESSGYGVVIPSAEEMRLEEPQVVKQDGRYGVRLKASAPSLHVIKAVINTEIAPVVGSEKQSEELINSLMENADDDPRKNLAEQHFRQKPATARQRRRADKASKHARRRQSQNVQHIRARNKRRLSGTNLHNSIIKNLLQMCFLHLQQIFVSFT